MKTRALMTTIELLDLIKSLNGNASDYRIAQILKVKGATVSRWRNLKGYFDDEICERVAEVTGLQPEYVVACVHAERAKTDSQRQIWTHIAAAFGTAAAVILAVAPHVRF